MKDYFSQRYKHYLFTLIGLLIGFGIGTLIIEEPDYITGISCVVIGLVIGESFMYIKWFRQKNNETDI
ncbi:hypothetical protein [Priestia endophytica]|uniref:hypothetical protein n=1 Tax=Priestia endophytica TaxID=135735 RepID=UPI002282A986|nr:hypothetical protein [Priestia endophytica]MCY8235455.1 SoxR reducing system RseC family protein [Priestia endophytica]